MKQQLTLFAFCLILSLVSLVAIGGFAHSASLRIEQDARSIAGGDIIVSANRPFSEDLTFAVEQAQDNGAQVVRSYEFSTIVTHKENSLLAWVRAVSDGFPFYGEYILESGEQLHLEKGSLVVDPSLLERLNATVGDSIRIGDATLVIAGVVVKEPGLDIDLFATSKVYLHEDDLDKTGLIGVRSRVWYQLLMKTSSGSEQLVEQLEEAAGPREEVETPITQAGGIQRFIRNTLSFLQVIALFTMLLGGIGMTTTLHAYIRTQKKSVAIMRALGMKKSALLLRYALRILFLTASAIAVSILLGYLLQVLVPKLFSHIIPVIEQVLSPTVIFEAILVGLGLTAAFTLLPFISMQAIRPIELIRKSSIKPAKWYYWLLVVFVVIGLLLLELESLATSLYFGLGFIGLLLVMTAISWGVLWLTRKMQPKKLWFRQALRGLFRPGNASLLIVTSIALSLTVIFSIALIQENLDNQFFENFPEDAPTVFFIDIQQDEVLAFQSTFEQDLTFFPVVRGSLLEKNGEPMQFDQEEEQRGESFSREFSLTYATDILPDEEFIEGSTLFGESDIAQISILDEVANQLSISVGDRLTFLIQGVELTAEISSIRKRTTNTIQPFFYFVFEPETLEKAPQTLFTFMHLEEQEIAQTQNVVAKKFPSVTTIDITQFASKAGEIVSQLSKVVQFFSILSILAGMLILISSIFATSLERLQEAVYYKILGAKKAFVRKVFLAEYLYLAVVSVAIAVVVSQIVAASIFYFVFELDYAVSLTALIPLSLAVLVLFPLVGMLVSLPLLKKKPVAYLRENAQE